MSEEQAAYEVEELTTIVSDTGRFAIVPEWVIDADLRPTAVRLYTVLSLMADRKTKTAHPSRRYLAKRCACSIRAVADALTELKKVGAIKIQHRKEGKEFDTSIYTVIRAAPAAVALPRAPDNPPQAKTDTTLGYSNCTENQSHKPDPPESNFSEEKSSSSGAREDDDFLSSLQDLYTDLPRGLSSPITAPAKFFAAVRENGSTIPRFHPTRAREAAEMILHALRPRCLQFPHPKEAAGLADVLTVVEMHPEMSNKNGSIRYQHLKACVGVFLCDDEDPEGSELNPDTVLTRLARQPDKLRRVIDLSG